jgi:hypothetical protein
MNRLIRSAVIAACVLGSAAPAAFAPPAFAQGYPPIPPPRVEVVPVAPGARYVWEPGHWVWNGRAYVWIGGHYVIRRAAYHEYVPGHWGVRFGRPVWIEPFWR